MTQNFFKQKIRLGQREVGEGCLPYLVAEMSGNHNQSLERAYAIVDEAAKCGAHALKIQTYTADTMTLDAEGDGFVIRDPGSLWHGKKLYDLYNEAYTPWDWHEKIMQRCRQYGMDFFSTPFDESAVDFLESLSVDFYKIASFENTDLPLIRRVAQTGKPVIVSTGMATLEDMQDVASVMQQANNPNLILLKCTSTYPAEPKNSHIRSIPDMKSKIGCLVGLSDHTMGVGVALASIGLGACLIEKHFTLRRSDGGVDSAFSMEPEEFHLLVEESRKAAISLGEIHYGPSDAERASLAFRRSLYVVADLKVGTELSPKNLRAVRPGLGLSPKFWDDVIGKKVLVDIKSGTPLAWEHIDRS